MKGSDTNFKKEKRNSINKRIMYFPNLFSQYIYIYIPKTRRKISFKNFYRKITQLLLSIILLEIFLPAISYRGGRKRISERLRVCVCVRSYISKGQNVRGTYGPIRQPRKIGKGRRGPSPWVVADAPWQSSPPVRVSSYVSLSAQYQLGHDAATRETPQKHRCFSSCVLLCSRGPPLAALVCPRWTLAYGMYSIHHVDTEITRSSGGSCNETSERVMFVSGFLRRVMDLERYSYATNE